MNTASADPSKIDEVGLVAGMRAGDETCFEHCVDRYGPRMLCVARRLLLNEDDAQDAVQEAFLSAFRAIEQFDGRSQVGTWLHRIVVNASLAKLRTRGKLEERSIDDLLPQFADDGHRLVAPIEWREGTAALLERSETRTAVREAIDQLPQIYRTVLLLRDIEEVNTEAAARLLDVTCAVVKTRLHRARQALRTLLGEQFQRGGL